MGKNFETTSSYIFWLVSIYIFYLFPRSLGFASAFLAFLRLSLVIVSPPPLENLNAVHPTIVLVDDDC